MASRTGLLKLFVHNDSLVGHLTFGLFPGAKELLSETTEKQKRGKLGDFFSSASVGTDFAKLSQARSSLGTISLSLNESQLVNLSGTVALLRHVFTKAQ